MIIYIGSFNCLRNVIELMCLVYGCILKLCTHNKKLLAMKHFGNRETSSFSHSGLH